MKTEFNEADLFHTFADYADREEDYESGLKATSRDFNKFLTYAEIIDDLIKNRRHLTTDQFIKLLTEYCRFMFNVEDMLKILSLMNGKKYVKYWTLKTQMFRDTEEGKCWYNYDIAYTEKANIDFSHYYSIDELKKLEASKEIVLLTEIEGDMWNWLDSINRKQDREYFKTHLTLDKFSLNSWFYDLSNYLKDSSNEFKLAVLKYIRTHVTNSTLRKCMRDYLKTLNDSLKDVTVERNGKEKVNKLIRMCNAEFETKGYNERLKQLNLEYGKYK